MYSSELQTCIKHCTQDERNVVFMEIKPHFMALATSTYAVHFVTKMLDHGMSDTKKSYGMILPIFSLTTPICRLVAL